jgi:hypothetical protein
VVKKLLFLIFLVFSGFMSAAARGTGGQDTGVRPQWVDTPSSMYPERLYVSAVGFGRDRREAEAGALGALTAYFRQSVTSTVTINDREEQVNGVSSGASSMALSIEAYAALDTLMGAEIRNAWNDTKNENWYAAAVMEKAACRVLYSGELDKAVTQIKVLIEPSGGVSFKTAANCRKARTILERAEIYALVLAMLDGPDRRPEISARGAGIAGLLAQVLSLPVDVRVDGDINGRLKAAFTQALTAEGFMTGGPNPRFVLEAAAAFAPAPQNRFFNTRYTVDAVLKDLLTGAGLFTYNAAGRESHPANQAEADNRALIGAERKITQEFPELLRQYLTAN